MSLAFPKSFLFFNFQKDVFISEFNLSSEQQQQNPDVKILDPMQH